MDEELEDYYVVLVDNSSTTTKFHTVEVSISKEDTPGTNIAHPIKVQPVHDSFFCARYAVQTSTTLC